MEVLTKKEKAIARRFDISYKDVHVVGHNSYGTVYGLYNNYFLTEMTFNGYTKAEIYRFLLRKFIKQIGII